MPLLLTALMLAQPDESFARGLELRDNAKAAHPHFVEAAKGYDGLWQAGDHSPALATNRARAHALAGDLPGAILAVRAGLSETPYDADLLRQLEAHRHAVGYPPNLRPERPGGWRTRLSPWDVFAAAAVGVLLMAVGLAGRFTTRVGWGIPLAAVGAVAVVLAFLVLWQLHREADAEAASPVLVVVRQTPLRKGNGETYPPRLDVELPRGAEVRERHRRGGWVQVELPNGVIGWIPDEATAR